MWSDPSNYVQYKWFPSLSCIGHHGNWQFLSTKTCCSVASGPRQLFLNILGHVLRFYKPDLDGTIT